MSPLPRNGGQITSLGTYCPTHPVNQGCTSNLNPRNDLVLAVSKPEAFGQFCPVAYDLAVKHF